MAHPTKPSKALYKHGPDAPTFDEIAQVIQKNLAALKKPGVISIRPGYKAVGDGLRGSRRLSSVQETKRPRRPPRTPCLPRWKAIPWMFGRPRKQKFFERTRRNALPRSRRLLAKRPRFPIFLAR
jgi:hypothetical protein